MLLQGSLHPDFGKLAENLWHMIPKDRPGGAALCVYHQGEKVVDIWGGSKDRYLTDWQEDTLAFSASTTKGVISTLMHILVNQGLADYEDKVAVYWPEFAQNGKQDVTIRHVMTHEAGLHRVIDLISEPQQLLDWDSLLETIASAKPSHIPGTQSAYHGLTYGHILGGIIEKITGKAFSEVLQRELVEPLDLDGMFIGVPDSDIHRCAKIISCDGYIGKGFKRYESIPRPLALSLYHLLRLRGIDLKNFKNALLPSFIDEVNFNDDKLLKAVIPAANGVFTARSLAKMYAMLANGGELEGVRLLSPSSTKKIQAVQSLRRDIVTTKRMNWRLGFHEAFTHRKTVAYGHYGFGGSGAFCDPELNLAVALTLNYDLEKVRGNLRFGRFSVAATRCARRRMDVNKNRDTKIIPVAELKQC